MVTYIQRRSGSRKQDMAVGPIGLALMMIAMLLH
jgi:hypothetical protein